MRDLFQQLENGGVRMIVGCPKEVKTREYRVGLVPGGVQALASRGHTVLLEKGAGLGSGIGDESYVKAGAQIVDSAREVWQRAQMIVKVKEPVEPEYGLLQEGQTIYTVANVPDTDGSIGLWARAAAATCFSEAEVTVASPQKNWAITIPIHNGTRTAPGSTCSMIEKKAPLP